MNILRIISQRLTKLIPTTIFQSEIYTSIRTSSICQAKEKNIMCKKNRSTKALIKILVK